MTEPSTQKLLNIAKRYARLGHLDSDLAGPGILYGSRSRRIQSSSRLDLLQPVKELASHDGARETLCVE